MKNKKVVNTIDDWKQKEKDYIDTITYFTKELAKSNKANDILIECLNENILQEKLAELNDLRQEVKELKKDIKRIETLKPYIQWHKQHLNEGIREYLLTMGDFKNDE